MKLKSVLGRTRITAINPTTKIIQDKRNKKLSKLTIKEMKNFK